MSLSLSLYLSVSLSLCVSGSVASVLRSTHAALSPFQSQYFVVIAADCFQGGDHINTETCSCYITSPSHHHTPFQPLFSFIPSFSLSVSPPSMGRFVCLDLFPCLHCLFPCVLSSLHLFVWIYPFFSLSSSTSIFVSPAAANEYLIYPLSLLSDGLGE